MGDSICHSSLWCVEHSMFIKVECGDFVLTGAIVTKKGSCIGMNVADVILCRMAR